MRPRDVACVVLASGLSSRFGETDKLQASLCGKSVLEHVLETISAVGFAEVFLVSRNIGFTDTTGVENAHPEKGQGHALRLGLAAAQSAGFQYVCVLLGDMPLVETGHIENLIARLTETDSVISLRGDQPMPPAAFGPDAISKILATKSRNGAKSILDELPLRTLPIAEAQALDVDTPEDLARIAAIMKAGKT